MAARRAAQGGGAARGAQGRAADQAAPLPEPRRAAGARGRGRVCTIPSPYLVNLVGAWPRGRIGPTSPEDCCHRAYTAAKQFAAKQPLQTFIARRNHSAECASDVSSASDALICTTVEIIHSPVTPPRGRAAALPRHARPTRPAAGPRTPRPARARSTRTTTMPPPR